MSVALDLGITDYTYKADYDRSRGVFIYTLHFSLMHTHRMYSVRGSAASPTQCHEAAMSYMDSVMREAVA